VTEQAGHKAIVKIKPKDSGSFTKINGVDNATLNRLAELLDVTQFGDTHKKRIAGLKDSNISLSGNYDPSDTNGQLLLNPGDEIYLQYLYDGTNGKQILMMVEIFEQSSAADGKQTFSSTLQGQAAPTAVP